MCSQESEMLAELEHILCEEPSGVYNFWCMSDREIPEEVLEAYEEGLISPTKELAEPPVQAAVAEARAGVKDVTLPAPAVTAVGGPAEEEDAIEGEEEGKTAAEPVTAPPAVVMEEEAESAGAELALLPAKAATAEVRDVEAKGATPPELAITGEEAVAAPAEVIEVEREAAARELPEAAKRNREQYELQPPGWTIETKSRKSGRRAGKKDPVSCRPDSPYIYF